MRGKRAEFGNSLLFQVTVWAQEPGSYVFSRESINSVTHLIKPPCARHSAGPAGEVGAPGGAQVGPACRLGLQGRGWL